MQIDRLDHIVLTIKDIKLTIDFYQQVLNMQHEVFLENRHALKFGRQKINLHEVGKEFEPKARSPAPGSADLCFITETPLDQVLAHLNEMQVTIEQGPIERTGATSKLRSVYIRDPDGNLIEISNQI